MSDTPIFDQLRLEQEQQDQCPPPPEVATEPPDHAGPEWPSPQPPPS